jgi:hypothetical protein
VSLNNTTVNLRRKHFICLWNYTYVTQEVFQHYTLCCQAYRPRSWALVLKCPLLLGTDQGLRVLISHFIQQFFFSSRTQSRSQLRYELPICCLQTCSRIYVNRVTRQNDLDDGSSLRRAGKLQVLNSLAENVSQMRKSQLLTKLRTRRLGDD